MTTIDSGPPAEPTNEARFTTLALGGASVTFVLIGLVSSVYGPLLIPFSHRFGLSVSRAGVVLSVHFLGSCVGMLGAWSATRVATGRQVLYASLGLLAAGALIVTWATRWNQLLGAVFVVGLGYGGLDFSLNTLLARTAEEGRARRLSVPNAGFGVGAVIGPLLVIAVHPAHFTTIFLIVGLVAAVSVALTVGVAAPPVREVATAPFSGTERSRRRRILGNFVGAYVIYIALETGLSGWIATDLRHEGHGATVASLVTALFWAGFALGRMLGGPLHRHVGVRRLVLVGLGATALLALGASVTAVAPWAFSVAGVALASIFPMGLIWYSELCPDDVHGLAVIIVTMNVGGVLGPSALSVAVALGGVHVVPVAIAALAALNVACFGYATRWVERVEPLVA